MAQTLCLNRKVVQSAKYLFACKGRLALLFNNKYSLLEVVQRKWSAKGVLHFKTLINSMVYEVVQSATPKGVKTFCTLPLAKGAGQ